MMRTTENHPPAVLSSPPYQALERLRHGNLRFRTDARIEQDLRGQVAATAAGQSPFAVVLGCIDSRVPPELVFDEGIGALFSIRVAGNVLSGDVLGSMEFACALAGASLIVVLGHTSCGAVQGACDGVKLGALTGLLAKIGPVIESIPNRAELSLDQLTSRVASDNVQHVIRAIRRQSPTLDARVTSGQLGMVGAMYSVATAEVSFGDLVIGTPAVAPR